tara:strand:+ start:297 stop:557 length:261 start_codon:yes stop_codon:yes gene_type:complete
MAIACAKLATPGQYGQFGVTKTLIEISSSRELRKEIVSSERLGEPEDTFIIASSRTGNSVPAGMPRYLMFDSSSLEKTIVGTIPTP